MIFSLPVQRTGPEKGVKINVCNVAQDSNTAQLSDMISLEPAPT